MKPEFQVTTNQADVGDVISQDPLPGTPLEKGKTVTITVGKAPAQVEVPDLTGLTQDEAVAALKAAHLQLGTPTTQPSDQPEGTVVSQDPLPGQKVDKGSTVDVVLSAGPAEVSVPDVVCECLGKAESDLGKAGFAGGHVRDRDAVQPGMPQERPGGCAGPSREQLRPRRVPP